MKNREQHDPRELAQKILLEYGVTELPVNVWRICEEIGICVLYDEEASGWQGVCCVRKKQPYILLKTGLSLERERYVLAHELGHLMQGHVGGWGNVVDRPDILRSLQEREAIAFGTEFIMPKILLPSVEVDDIKQLCGVSRAMAIYRCSQIRKKPNT